MRCLALVALVAACGGGKSDKPKVSRDAGGAAVGPATDAADTTIPVTPLAADVPLPAGAKRGSVRVAGVEFVDAAGTNRVFLLERRTTRPGSITIALDAFHVIGDREVIHVKDLAERCGMEATRFAGEIDVTDVDADRTGEIAFAYAVGCGEGDVTIKQLWLEGGTRYSLRGTSAADATPEPEAASWPPGFFEAAQAAYTAVAEDLVGSAAAGGDRVSSGTDFESVDLSSTAGDVEIEMSHPQLAGMIPAATAAELTKRMRAFLRAGDTGWTRGRTGNYWASCEVGMSTPEVISIECERLDGTLTHAEQSAGTGGVAGEPTRHAFVSWLDGSTFAALDPVELFSDPRALVARCGPIIPELVALRREGVVVLGDEGHDRPETCEPVDWADTRPTSARAKRLVARLSSDP